MPTVLRDCGGTILADLYFPTMRVFETEPLSLNTLHGLSAAIFDAHGRFPRIQFAEP
jgi:hypothetical protein